MRRAAHITTAVEEGIAGIAPGNFSTLAEIQIARHIYEPLLNYSPRSELLPGIFSRWQSAARGTEWTFTVRRNSFFHNGDPITADAVIWNLHEHITWFTGLIRYVRRIHKRNTHTLTLELNAPVASLLHRFAGPQAFLYAPQPAGARKKPPTGSGPFKAVRPVPGADYLLKRMRQHAQPQLARYLAFKQYHNGNQMWDALVDGKADVVYECPYEYISDTAIQPQIIRRHCPSLSVNMLLLNNEGQFFSKLPNRRLFAAAIRQQQLIDTAMQGVGVASTGPVSPASQFYAAPRKERRANQFKAAPHGSGPIPVLVQSCYNPLYIDEVQRQASAAGIHTEMVRLPVGELIGKVLSGDYEAAFMGTAGMEDPDILLYDFFHSNGRSNLSRFRHADYDALVDKARHLSRFGVRKELYRQAVEVLRSQSPAIFLRHGLSLAVHHERIGGIEPYPDNFLRLEYATCKQAT